MVFSWHFSAHIHWTNVFACLKLKKNKCHILCKHPNLSFGWFGPGAGWTSHTAYCSPRRHAYAKWDFQYLERMATNSTLYGDWNWARNMRQICSIALVLMPAIWLDEALRQMTIGACHTHSRCHCSQWTGHLSTYGNCACLFFQCFSVSIFVGWGLRVKYT